MIVIIQKNMKKSYYIFVKEDSTSKSNGNYTTFQQSTGDEWLSNVNIFVYITKCLAF